MSNQPRPSGLAINLKIHTLSQLIPLPAVDSLHIPINKVDKLFSVIVYFTSMYFFITSMQFTVSLFDTVAFKAGNIFAI